MPRRRMPRKHQQGGFNIGKALRSVGNVARDVDRLARKTKAVSRGLNFASNVVPNPKYSVPLGISAKFARELGYGKVKK